MYYYLLAKGAQVNVKDKEGITSLYLASKRGRGEVAKILIAHGADINIKSNTGDTPLGIAVRNGWNELAQFLIVKGADANTKLIKEAPLLHWSIKKYVYKYFYDFYYSFNINQYLYPLCQNFGIQDNQEVPF